MADRPSLPNTESLIVMQAAIAFEIASDAINTFTTEAETPAALAKEFTEIYMTSWNTIIGRKEQEKK